jgi:hypothetical protein
MKTSLNWLALFFFAVWTGSSFGQAPFVPGSAESIGLQRIVPDAICNFNQWNGDGIRHPQQSNWEPYTSVLGNSVFLIESNTYAVPLTVDPSGSAAYMQSFAMIFQAVDGSNSAQGEAFFADDGTPYAGPINNYRNNGNPGRVAGDKRPGATNLIAGGETSADEFTAFQSDSRWKLGLTRGGRYATVQTYSLDPTMLTQTPASKAFDAIMGRLTSGDASQSAGGTELTRFGGDMAALSNGNFVVVADDRSNLFGQGPTASAVIVAPDGTIVQDTFVIGSGAQLWSNVCAFNGGFCVRYNGILYFFDNTGTMQSFDSQQDAEVVDNNGNVLFAFNGDRGDGTRIASHINSNFVFMAGANTASGPSQVRLAAWNAQTGTFVASINVNELTAANGGTDSVDFQPTFDRVNLAVDALNRVLVTYTVQPQGFQSLQVAARVLAFDATTGTFSYLTPTFFPFINTDTPNSGLASPVASYDPSPSMTTKQLLIAAKGLPNTMNMPQLGTDLAGEEDFYSVITHPAPMDDPTPPPP